MSEKKQEEVAKEVELEMSEEELDAVSGGALRDVRREVTKDIDESIKERI